MKEVPQNVSDATRRRNPHLYNRGVQLYSQGSDELMDFATKPAPKTRLRQSSKPLLNKLESEFLTWLNPSVRGIMVRAQAKTYRLANGLRYTPDFTAVVEGRETAWEVKGKWVDGDSFPKLKTAASVFPEVRWLLVWKGCGSWMEQEILP